MTKKIPIWFILGSTPILTLTFLASSRMLSVQAQESSADATSDETFRVHSALHAATKAEQDFSFDSAIKNLEEAMEFGFANPIAHYKKGCWHFRAGNIPESKRAFDRYVELVPARAKSQWERGITCYYAKEYKAGAQQFVDYQSYHDNDVENAVWRYLCQVKVDGKEKAQKAILPIRNDTRIPMMEIYRLFRGESTPERVLAELEAERSTGPQARHQNFDAHLYLALYYDSEGDLDKANQHIKVAVKQFKRGDYMWAVAVEHQKHIKRQQEQARKGHDKKE